MREELKDGGLDGYRRRNINRNLHTIFMGKVGTTALEKRGVEAVGRLEEGGNDFAAGDGGD